LFRPFVLARAQGSVAPSVATYLRRRALRILPAYWVCVAVCMTVLPQSVPVSGGDWLRYLTLTQIYVPNWGRPGLTQTWSLATQAAFYVLLPLLAALALAGRWRPVRAAAVSGGAGLLASAGWLAGMATGHVSYNLQESWPPAH